MDPSNFAASLFSFATLSWSDTESAGCFVEYQFAQGLQEAID